MSFWKFMLCIIIPVTLAVVTIAFYVLGKVKLKRALRPIEYYPPRGYSPIDVMIKYYSHRCSPRNVINPLMLYWASRGLITIEEDCKRGLKLTKLKDITPSDEARSVKGKQIKENYKAEKQLFNDLFSDGPVLYTLAAPASFKNVHKKFTDGCKENAKKGRTLLTNWLSGLGLMFAVLSLLLVTIINGTTYHDEIYIAMLFPIIAIILFKAIPNEDALTTIIKYPFICVWGGAPFAAVLSFVTAESALLLGIAAACSLVTVWFSQRIDIRSDRDLEIYGRICAFKQFLIDAEKDQLETLIEENPNYYYDILPFCYVLKITEKLKEKFDRITTDGPSWYLGELRDTLMF